LKLYREEQFLMEVEIEFHVAGELFALPVFAFKLECERCEMSLLKDSRNYR